VREKRERKWGLTGSWRLYPIFALLLFTTHYSPHTTHNRSCHPTMVLAQKSRPPSQSMDPSFERAKSGARRKWGLTGSCGLYPIFALPTTNNQQPLLSSHIGSRSEEPSIVHRPRAWTRPWREREEERKRESKRKERAKMGTDLFLRSVPDFRSSASRDLALTNDFRTVALYHTPLTTAPVIPHWFSLRRAVHRQSSQTVDPSFESARRGEKERE